MPLSSALLSLVLCTYVIPPGQEALLKSMVAPTSLPAGWTFAGASLDKTVVHIRFKQGGTVHVVDLAHPKQAPEGGILTAQFAVLPPGGMGTDHPLVKHLLERVKKGESSWQWLWVDEDAPRSPGPAVGKPEGTDPAGGQPSGSPRGEHGSRLKISEALSRADHAIKTRDFKVAEELVRSALADAKTAWAGGLPAWLELWVGLVYRGLEKPAEAAAHFQAAVKAAEARAALPVAADDKFQSLLTRARALLYLGKDEDGKKALAELDAATERELRCSMAVVAQDQATLGAPDAAVAYLKALAEKEPRCPKLYVLAGEIARDHNKMNEVGALLEQGAKLFPDDSPVVTQFADYQKFKGRREEAIKTLEALVDKGKHEPGMIGELLGLYTRAGIPDETVAKFKSRADADTNDYVSAFFAGVLLHYKQRYEESNRYLERCKKPMSREPRLYIYLAMNHFHLGDQPLASELIERGVSVGMTDPDVYYCRAIINTDTDPEGAIRDLERYLTLTKNAFDVFEPKQKTVAGLLERMRECVDARVPSECVSLQKEARSGLLGAAVAGVVVLLAVPLVIAWRRKKTGSPPPTADSPPAAPVAALLLALGLGAGVAQAAERAGLPPPLPDGAALVRGLDAGEGWRGPQVHARPDELTFRYQRDDGPGLELVLMKKGHARRPFATTRSFDISYTGRVNTAPQVELLKQFVEAVRRNDDGAIQLAARAERGLGPVTPASLAAQLTWMPPLERAQVAISALLLAAGVFSSGPRGGA